MNEILNLKRIIQRIGMVVVIVQKIALSSNSVGKRRDHGFFCGGTVQRERKRERKRERERERERERDLFD
jgi:hypothetical protein